MSGIQFCSYCGAVNKEESIFCVSCGKPLVSDDDVKKEKSDKQAKKEAPQAQPDEREQLYGQQKGNLDRAAYESYEQPAGQNSQYGGAGYGQGATYPQEGYKEKQGKARANGAAPAKKKKKGLIIAIIIIALLLIAGGVFAYFHFFVNKTVEIDLTKNYSTEKMLDIDSYSSSATIKADIDANEISDYSGDDEEIVAFLDSVTYTIDGNAYDLEDGDKVYIIADYDEEQAEELNIDITKNEGYVTISVLTSEEEYEDFIEDYDADDVDGDYDFLANTLSTDEIENMTDAEIQGAINIIWAMNGYKFEDEELKEYFESTDWYNNIKQVPTAQIESVMKRNNPIQYENSKNLQEERESRRDAGTWDTSLD